MQYTDFSIGASFGHTLSQNVFHLAYSTLGQSVTLKQYEQTNKVITINHLVRAANSQDTGRGQQGADKTSTGHSAPRRSYRTGVFRPSL